MQQGPVWYSHRGLYEDGAENSRQAFERAVAAGFDGLETDLRVSRDGEIFLCHDPDLTRVAGVDALVSRMSTDDLRRVRCTDGQGLLSLREFVDAFASQRWIFDIKPESAAGTMAALGRWAAQDRRFAERLQTQTRFLFWRADQQRAAERALPGIACLARERECWRAGLAVLVGAGPLGGIRPGVSYGLPPRFRGIALYRSSFVDAYRRRGARLLAFLPRDASDVAAAVACGFDDILLDNHKPCVTAL